MAVEIRRKPRDWSSFITPTTVHGKIAIGMALAYGALMLARSLLLAGPMPSDQLGRQFEYQSLPDALLLAAAASVLGGVLSAVVAAIRRERAVLVLVMVGAAVTGSVLWLLSPFTW